MSLNGHLVGSVSVDLTLKTARLGWADGDGMSMRGAAGAIQATTGAKVVSRARLLPISLLPVLPVLLSAVEPRVLGDLYVKAALVEFGFTDATAHPPAAPLDPMVVPACQD